MLWLTTPAGKMAPKGLPYDIEPEIEPKPGAWRGQTINTGGGGYFGRDFEGTYVGGNRKITITHEDRSIRNLGRVSHSVQVTGDRNKVNARIGGNPEGIPWNCWGK